MSRNDTRSFAAPTGECDLVMEGGITSGVVYPATLLELGTRYRFRSVGGTSAGAIAAALAAATEYGRDSGGFELLRRLPEEIGGKLLGLFQPAPRYRGVFAMFLACLGNDSGLRKLLRLLWAVLRYQWPVVLAGLVPAFITAGLAARTGWTWPAICLLLLLAAIGPVLAVPGWNLSRLMRGLPRSGFGLCIGLKQPGFSGVALTEWLIGKLDALAGLSGRHLTIGDLAQKNIALRTMTTNLSQRRPHALPFSAATLRLYSFRPEEWRKYFPAEVVDTLVEHGSPVEGFAQYRHLPAVEFWPVIVPVRLSLSFPLLLSAVPLYCRDFTRGRDESAPVEPSRCWFSDGGIASNFPIHFFDSLLPSRPTFGIRLTDFNPQRDGEDTPRNRVYMPKTARGGQLLGVRDMRSVSGFVLAIVDTARIWQHSMQGTLPGYRERVARIALDPTREGGLNITMPPELVEDLTEYGRIAGEDMLDFEMDEHRWRRFLVAYARLEHTLAGVSRAYDVNGYQGFLQTYPAKAASYRQDEQWIAAVRNRFDALMQIARSCRESPLAERGSIPKPDTDMRITPEL